MGVAIITGSAGLIGSEAVRFFSGIGMDVVGIDNDMRKFFFGEEASTKWNRQRLEKEINNYQHREVDIRNYEAIEEIFQHFGNDISLIIHTAAQPSHDWAAKDPFSDFTVNANGTLNLLQATREYCPEAVFIFYFYQQSLRRLAQCFAPRGIRQALGDRFKSSLYGRNT